MTTLVLVLVLIGTILFGYGVMATVPNEDKKKWISLDEVLVGDKIHVKGEEFTVKAYANNGIMEVEKETTVYGKENQRFLVKTKDCTFLLHLSGDKRKYIDLIGLKGTVGGDYLERVNF